MNRHAICDACETVAHCSSNGCVPVVSALTHRTSQRPLRDHAPEIADSLLAACEQRTRMHRAITPTPAPTDSLAARLAADLPARPIDTPSLLVSFLILVLACMAAAGLVRLIDLLIGIWP